MKKILGVSVCLLSLLCVGCAAQKPEIETQPIVEETTLGQLPIAETIMMEYIVDRSIPMDGKDGVLSKTTYSVYYDGKITACSEYNGYESQTFELRQLSPNQTTALYGFLQEPVDETEGDESIDAKYSIIKFDANKTVEMSFTGFLTNDYVEKLEHYLFDVIYGREGVLCEISYVANAPTPDRDDVWESSNWTVYFDGTVEYYDLYKGGPSETQTWTMKEKQITKLTHLLSMGVPPSSEPALTDVPMYLIRAYKNDTTNIVDFWGTPDESTLNNILDLIR